jgi:hypothetical protein
MSSLLLSVHLIVRLHTTISAWVSLLDLVTVVNGDIRVVRPLKEGELQAFSTAAALLYQAERSLHAIQMVDRNEEEFHQEQAKSSAEFSKEGLEARSLNRFAFRANWRLVNYLASMRFFLDFTETRIKRRFGKESSEAQQFKRACSEAFDGEFAYRFLYKLRNYAQHCGLPIGSLDVSGQPPTSDAPAQAELTLYFSADQLLADYDEWGVVNRDLEAMSAPFPVNPLVTQMTAELHKLQVLSIQLEFAELKQAGRDVLDVLKDALGTPGVPALCEVHRRGEDERDFEITWPPIRMLQHLRLLKYG